MKRENVFISAVTFIGAFCSIIYELVLAQTLTVVFGGTVLRYSSTIGLFLFSLGLGAFLYEYIKGKVHLKKFFFFSELILAVLGFSGVFLIVYLNGPLGEILPYWFLLTLSHIPIILIGIFSGLELPVLTEFETKKRFAVILGTDYFGSLVGSIIFAIILYPNFGLLTTSIAVSLLNALIAVSFAIEYRLFSKKIILIMKI